MVRRVALALFLMILTGAVSGSDPEFLRQYEKQRAASGQVRRAAPLAIPARADNNPEYLVRIIYYVPTDRVPGDSQLWDEKRNIAQQRIRLVAEAMEDYFAWEMENWDASTTGERINFERDDEGNIRVLALQGRLATKGASGLWGDNEGLDWVGIHFRVLDDIFGSDLGIREAFFQKTTYLIFSDAMEMRIVNGNGEFRGYLGGGSSYKSNSSGWGGYGHISAGILELWEGDPGTTESDRIDALASSLCNTTNPITIGGVTGPVSHWAPENNVIRPLMQGELASVYMGVIAHELTHAFGIVHDWVTPDPLMHASYLRMGAAYRELYAMPACAAVPLTGAAGGFSKLGTAISEVLSHCPYFVDAANSDRIDPTVSFSWPPSGYIDARELNSKAVRFRVTANDTGGSGSNAVLLYSTAELVDFALAEDNSSHLLKFTPFWWDRYVGRRVFNLSHYDKAGNHVTVSMPVFNFYFDEYALGVVQNNTVFVRRPAGEDNRPRNTLSAKGSFQNPYDTPAQAITAAAAMSGARTVIVCRGTHPVAASLKLFPDISITGEGIGTTILDGGGGSHPIILDDSTSTRLQNVAISNLVFQNAGSGVYKSATHNQSWEITISNNIFRNLSAYAIHHTLMWSNIRIEQNTIVNCGTGIYLEGWAPFVAADRFGMRNNVVTGCTTGINMVNLGPFRTQGTSGYNNSWNNGTNWTGNGSFGGQSYASVRLPGEFSANPRFAGDGFTPGAFSPLLRRGDPVTENIDGSRRDIGAVIDNPADETHGWVLLGE